VCRYDLIKGAIDLIIKEVLGLGFVMLAINQLKIIGSIPINGAKTGVH